MAQPEIKRPGVLAVLVLLDELLLLVVLAVAGAGIGGPLPLRVILATALPLACVVIWGRWLAPRAPRRLEPPGLLTGKVGMALIASLLLAATGPAVWAGLFFVFSAALMAIAESRPRPAPRQGRAGHPAGRDFS